MLPATRDVSRDMECMAVQDLDRIATVSHIRKHFLKKTCAILSFRSMCNAQSGLKHYCGVYRMRFARVVLLLSLGLAIAPAAVGDVLGQSKPAISNRASSAELAFRNWLSSFDKNGTRVGFAAITYDDATDTLTVQNLKISVSGANTRGVSRANTELLVESLSLTSLNIDSQGLRFDAATADNLQLILAGSKDRTARAERIQFMHAFVPNLAAFVFDPTKPVSSQISFLRLMAQIQAGEMKAARVSFGDGTSLAALELNDISAGKISRAEVNEFQADLTSAGFAPVRGERSNSRLSAYLAKITNIDLEPYLRMFEPSAYLDAGSARPWSNLVESIDGRDIVFINGPMKFSTANTKIGPLKLRQFSENLTDIFDRSAVEPDYLGRNPVLVTKITDAVRDAFRLENASFRDVTLSLPAQAGSLTVTLGSGDVSGFSANRVDQVRLQSLMLADPTGNVGLASLEVGGIDFPAPTATSAGSEEPLVVVPTINSVSGAGLRIDTQQINLGLDKVNLAMSYFVGATPTKLRANVEGLKFQSAQVAVPAVRQTLTDLGYKDVELSLNLSASWEDSSSAIAFDAVDLTGKDMGTLSISGAITGITRASFEHPQQFLSSELSASGVRNLRVSFENGSLVERLIEQAAKQNDKSIPEIKKLLSSNMPAIMARISPSDLRNKFTFAAISFINDPQILNIVSRTSDTNAFSDILSTLGEPYKLPALLKLDASANSRRR